jgi:hypothetical protein
VGEWAMLPSLGREGRRGGWARATIRPLGRGGPNGSGRTGRGRFRARGFVRRHHGQPTRFSCNSASCVRSSRISPCIWDVTAPTKKKHMGRNAKKVGRHQPASEPTDADRAMSEMKAQKAAAIQCLTSCLMRGPFVVVWCGEPRCDARLGSESSRRTQRTMLASLPKLIGGPYLAPAVRPGGRTRAQQPFDRHD